MNNELIENIRKNVGLMLEKSAVNKTITDNSLTSQIINDVNQPQIYTLRPYQAKLVSHVKVYLSKGVNCLIDQPTGSGKSIAIKDIVISLFGIKFSKIIIAAPQQQIEEGFYSKKNIKIKYPEINGATSSELEIPKNLFSMIRENKGSISKSINRYLKSDPNKIIICTHQALSLSFKDNINSLPEDLTGCLLVIDEAHHSAAEGLNSVIDTWVSGGGNLLYATATPYRKDGKEVCYEGMKVFRRPLAEHMEEGFAPQTLHNEIIGVSVNDEVTANEFFGEEVSNHHMVVIANTIADTFERDGKPKSIIRIPPGNSIEFAKIIQEVLEKRFPKIRILNGVGTDNSIKQNFINVLNKEKGKSYNDSKYDVVLGVQRVLEGTDWAICSHIYCVGVPGSLTTVTQLIGRALRQKDDLHKCKNEAKASFFVLGIKEKSLNKLDLKHSRHALLTCIFLADYNIGKEWIVTKAISNGIKAGLVKKDLTKEQVDDAENDIRGSIDPEERAEVELIILAASEMAKENNEEFSPEYIYDFIDNKNIDVNHDILNQIIIEHLSSKEDKEDKVSKKTKDFVKKNISLLPKVDKFKKALFEELVVEFRNETLSDSLSLIGDANQIHSITGGGIKDFCDRLIASNVSYTIEQVKQWVEDYKENNNGKFPSEDSGDIRENNITWLQLNGFLITGSRGLGGYKSLPDFLKKECGKVDINYTVEQVKQCIEVYKEKVGKFPSCHSGDIEEIDATWAKLNDYFRRGSRGLIGYKSLSDFLEKEYGKVEINYTIEQVKEWVDEYKEKNGKFPTQGSGDIEGGETSWSKIANYFRIGSRGLIGYKSLLDFLERGCGKTSVSYTIEQIKEWVDEYKEKNGKFPHAGSGDIEGIDISWANINGYFKIGSRGLCGYESLPDFLKKEYESKVNITTEQIKQYIENYKEKNNGKYPVASSGNIEGTNFSWSNFYQYFSRGSKGLIGYGSFLNFLEKEYGYVQKTNYTVEQIKKLVEDYRKKNNNKFPSRHSGDIGGIDINWSKIDNYFRRKQRGLIDYKSLPDFLEKECGKPKKA